MRVRTGVGGDADVGIGAIPGAMPAMPQATMTLAFGQRARSRQRRVSSCEFIFLPHIFLPKIRFPIRIGLHRPSRVTSEVRADTGREPCRVSRRWTV